MTSYDNKVALQLLGGILASTAFVAAVVAGLIVFDLQVDVIRFLRWLNDTGVWAYLVFAFVMAMVVVLLLPGVLLTTGAGFVFGVAAGTAVVVCGTTLGAVVAFLISRETFGERASRYILRHPKMSMLNATLEPRGWKVVCMTRFIPFFPAKLANYFFGLTSVSLRAFAFGSIIGFIPLSLHNVYLGAIAAELTVDSMRRATFGDMQLAVYIAGLAAVTGAVTYLARVGWRALYADTS